MKLAAPARRAARVLALLVLPQLVFWLARLAFSIERPLFNLDLIVATLIACISLRWGLAALILFWGIDIARATSFAYHFVTPLEFIETVRFANMVGLGQVVSWPVAAAVAGLALCAWLFARVIRQGDKLLVPIVAAAMLLAAFDVLNGSTQLLGLGSDRLKTGVNIVGSPSWNLYGNWRDMVKRSAHPMQPLREPQAYAALQDWHRRHPDDSLLLVLVESMGLPSSPALRQWLVDRLATERLSERWTIAQREDAFNGPTTYGELRVLCGLYGHYSRLLDGDAARCLPRQLHADGMRVQGLHGFQLSLFDRQRWWPRVGLEPWNFPADGLPTRCNEAFAGVCDSAVLHQAVRLADEPRRFVYALTLDTHLPLHSQGVGIPAPLARICAAEQIPDPACRMVAHLGHVLGLLEHELATLRTAPYIAVVGDHSPPFVSNASRQAFVPQRVPMYLFEPRR